MAYVTLELVKRHLVIDESYTDDDAYIEQLIDAAEAVVSKDVCDNLKNLEDEQGKIPAPLCQCVLLMVGNLYNNRESIAFAQAYEVPLSYKHLVGLYRNYAG